MFPFALPATTRFYLAIYGLTLVVHAVCAGFVLGSCCHLFLRSLKRCLRQTEATALEHWERDWLPFAFSATMTAGVAPLLFVQIVYRHHFYSANLLLWWRWMLMIPLLLLGFYFLYLAKRAAANDWHPRWRLLIDAVTLSSFFFTGLGWSVNHLLALLPQSWPATYVSGTLPIAATTLGIRVMAWLAIAIVLWAAAASWRLVELQPGAATAGQQKRIAATGVVATIIAAVVCVYQSSTMESRFGSVTVYGVILLISAALLAVCWGGAIWRPQPSRRGRLVITAAALGLLVCALMLREAHRLNQLGGDPLFQTHGAAAAIEGFWLFVFFFLVNSGLAGVCLQLVRRARQRGT